MLGGVLIGDIGIRVLVLAVEDFYSPMHQRIYKAMLALDADGVQPDLITVKHRLHETEQLEAAGGWDRLLDIADMAMPGCNYRFLEKIITDASRRRGLIAVGHDLVERGGAADGVDGLLESSKRRLVDLTRDPADRFKVKPFWAVVDGFLADLRRKDYTPYPARTCTILDQTIGGFGVERPVYIASRTGAGKTTFALQTAVRNARAGTPVLFFSLEMEPDRMAGRALAAAASLDGVKLMHHKVDEITPGEWERLAEGEKLLRALPLYMIRPDGPMTAREIEDLSRRQAVENGIGLIVIDHLARIRTTSGTLYEEMTRRAYEVAAMVSALRLPILVAVQINREGDGAPMLKHLEGSGVIEQTAQAVLILHDLEPENQAAHEIEVLVAKNDSGPLGRKKLTKSGWKFTIE